MKIDFIEGISKFQQLIDALVLAINREEFRKGDCLPSINQLSTANNISRDTALKACQELMRRGLVESRRGKGYFVAGNVNRIFMLLDTYSPFKDVLYNSFAKSLPKEYTIDLLFHHYNLRVFESVINDSLGRYSMYVVMNFNNDRINDSLRKIDPSRILILDWGKYKAENYSYVCQDFDKAFYDCLAKALPMLRKYRKLVMYIPESSPHPRSSITFFKQFCRDYGIRHEVVTRIEERNVKPGTAYIVIPQRELVEMVKFCRNRNLKLGREAGLIAYNDSPLYEVIDKGITVISTDFTAMGKKAAEFITTRQKVREIIPTRLIVRGTV
jgi:DNA-binding transcriptional regulator YhcF (GntR family)